MRVHMRLLGGFEVAVDGQAGRRAPLAPALGSRARQAAGPAPRRRLLREQVIDALWPDLLLDEASPRLHKAAHYARAALGSREAVVARSRVPRAVPLGGPAGRRRRVRPRPPRRRAPTLRPEAAARSRRLVRRRPAPGRPLRAVDRGGTAPGSGSGRLELLPVAPASSRTSSPLTRSTRRRTSRSSATTCARDAAGPHSRRSTGSRRRSSRSWASSPVPRLRSCGGRPRPCRRPACPDPTAGRRPGTCRAPGPAPLPPARTRLIGRADDLDAVVGAAARRTGW